MANKIEKQKGVVVGVGIVLLVLSLVGVIGGIALLVTTAKASSGVGIALHIVFGILAFAAGVFSLVCGVRIVWIGGSVKATHGSISEDNLGKSDASNTKMKVCEKCGCTNTVDSTVCSNCGAEL